MATILMVHGTFASGPDEGSAWWQRGGDCCKHVGELIAAEQGEISVEPFGWDGLNSEKSRQAAGERLLARMQALEKAGEPYSVVGHSHGGSVTAAALIQAAHSKTQLANLSRWITVGTPFIMTEREKFAFSRLEQGGKVAVLTLLSFFIATSVMVYSFPSEIDAQRSNYYLVGLWGTALLAPILIAWPIIWYSQRNAMPWHRPRTQRIASEAFASKWLSLRHDDDEAVQSLASLEAMKQPIFPPNFAVAAISKLSILLVPLAIFLLMVIVNQNAARHGERSPEVQAARAAALKGQPVQSQASPSVVSSTATQPATKAGTPTSPAGSAEERPAGLSEKTSGLLAGLFGIGVLVLLPWLLYRLIRRLAYPISRGLSFGLNRMAWSQLQAMSLGNDVEGEKARHARPHPAWIATSRPLLPEVLRQEISKASDEAAAKAVSKIRAGLSELGIMQIEKDGKDVLNTLLTGEELIHTTYFKVERFRKLLAYALAHSPGFRPTAAFERDPDYALVAMWYAGLVANQEQSAKV